jgi:hypothetical protein
MSKVITKTAPRRATKPRAAAAKTDRAASVKKAAAPAVAPMPDPTFSKGQRWDMLVGQAEIVHVGKILIDYRLHTLPAQRRTPIRTDLLADFTRTIKRNKAKLVGP